MDGLHNALYVAALIAFAGAVDRARHVRSHAAASRRHPETPSSGRSAHDRAPAGLGFRPPSGGRRSSAAALEVFGSGSYAGSTTAEIARAACVSEPIIYRHFPSKRELWFAASTRHGSS